MTDTQEAVEVEDPVPAALYNYGLSGEPLRMAPTPWQSAVQAMRQANVGVLAVAAVQPILDVTFPDAGYQAADLCLASPPVGTYTFTAADQAVTFTADDSDLPAANVQWDFGDRTTAHGVQVEHSYQDPGLYTVTVSAAVAGSIWNSTQDIEVGDVTDVVPLGEEFDPGEHTVDDVLTYADANPELVDRLIGMEEVGKARVTLLEKLHARVG